MTAVFQLTDDPRRVIATEAAMGPWSPTHCHGGAPAALVTRAAEQVPTLAPMAVSRLTLELLRPAPLGPFEVSAEVLREGKKLQLVEVSLRAGEAEVARARVLKLRVTALALPDGADAAPLDLPGPHEGQITQGGLARGFGANFTLRAVKGAFWEGGPAAIWFRLDAPMFEGEPTSPAVRAAAAADFGNGISGILPFDAYTFLNADLTVNFARAPVGDWIVVDAETWVDRAGRALARSRLGDERGWFGAATQSLLLEAR
jgi:acyl-coenzyme A thioesterase PaaI-like protein